MARKFPLVAAINQSSNASMAEVILLNDVVTPQVALFSRYIGPYVLATQLEKAGFSVAVIDYFTEIPDFFSYIEEFLEPSTLFVGISSTFLAKKISSEKFAWMKRQNATSVQAFLNELYCAPGLWLGSSPALDQWLEKLKTTLHRHNPHGKIVLGGARASEALHRPEQFRHLDYVAISASDVSLVEFAKSLRQQMEPASFSQNGLKVINNLEALKKKTCPETQFHSGHAILPGEALPLEVSRGCIFNCKFCNYDKKESLRKDINVLREEIIRNYENFGTTVYHFCDDCFNDSRTKVEEICGMLLKLPFKVEWISYARVDVAVRFPHTIDLMIESGARGLFFGLESFHPIVARNAGKGTPPDKVKEFLLDFRKKYRDRCLLEGSFIVGLPGETAASQRETIRWISDNDILDCLTVFPLGISQYEEKLDKVAVDYAEYSRNPKLFGFHYVDHINGSWKHDTMDSEEASLLAGEFWETWQKGRNSLFRAMWRYPFLRTLGFSPEEIMAIARAKAPPEMLEGEVATRSQLFLQQYWRNLIEKNRPHELFLHPATTSAEKTLF